MRILYVVQHYLPEMGALPGRASEMAREWTRAGHEVEILAPVPNHPTGVVPPEYRGVRVFRETDEFGVEATRAWIYTAPNKGKVRRSLAFGSFGAVSFAIGAGSSKRPDVVVGSSPQLLAAVSAMGIAAVRRVPFVLEIRDLWPESVVAVGALPETSPVVQGLYKVADALHKNAKRVVVVTRTFETILAARGVAREKIAFVPNGVDLTRFVPRPARPEDRRELGGDARFVVAYFGTHGMAHDLGRVIDVAEKMRDRKDVAFAFVGDGAERKSLEARARAANLGNVRFLGVQPRERMPELYAASDLLVVPLRKTDVFTTVLPSKIFEIMGMAKPLVLAVDGEARGVVEAAGCGWFVPPGDSDALHAMIERRLSSSEDLAEAGARGREYVAREFDRKALAHRYLDVLESARAD